MVVAEELPEIVKLARECALLGDYDTGMRHFEKAIESAEKQHRDCGNVLRLAAAGNDSIGTWNRVVNSLKSELALVMRGSKMIANENLPRVPEVRRISSKSTNEVENVPIWKQQVKPQQIVARKESTPTRKPRTNKTPVPNRKKKTDSNELPPYSETMENSPDIELIRTIESTMLTKCPGVKSEDIAGLDDAKAVLEEAVLYPQLMPSYYTGIRRPWKGVLLFGPPGTGKTMLAKAIATECNTCFFNVGSSSIASKWRGESEKMVSILFDMARYHAPATIFFDEVDSIASARGGSSEHEASRRVKSELLTQMDGVSNGEDKTIVVLAATNLPWELDDAIRRRLEKRIYIPLPVHKDRTALLKLATSTITLEAAVNFDELAANTEGYSGADITNVCHEASMMPIRRLIEGAKQAVIARGGGRDEIHKKMKELSENQPTSPPVCHEDFIEAIGKVSSSVGGRDLNKYQEWLEEYGAT